MGAHYICDVCIKSGNSCCQGCALLKDGIGCQKRNTSCTAWLCGLQKFYLNEIDLLDDWERLWEQVPGRYYRKDFTPESVTVKSLIHVKHPNNQLAKKIASKLEMFVQKGGNLEKLEKKLSIEVELRNVVNIQHDPPYSDN